ncbi:aldose epimerase family protein [Muriicola soli]|uniref:Galactose mutarotase n=1 Tax=Muriicola soli TaxID=2507538 RepID=A0A411EA72_9FLAO|nr:aldose epimerase family protein [Muriicola soli]QBA64625.1 galactose mutarotase [Muriicola soli]
MKQVTIKNDFFELTTLDYGAIVQKLMFRDKQGKPVNCVVGFEDPEEYLEDVRFLGACIGRFAGRISGNHLRLGDKTYPINSEKGVHLHGGKKGLGRRTFNLSEVGKGKEPFVTYEYLSPHLEEGYPGNLKVKVTYQLIGNGLKITHKATTDQLTIVNLTNHSYFRLDQESCPDHLWLQLCCKKRLKTGSGLLPTGELVSVTDTEYDFQKARPLGKTRLDTPYVVDQESKPQVIAWSPVSGIRMQVETNQPAIVVFTPKDLPSICFETQNFPDAPNHTKFPSCLLQPGETYKNESVFSFDLVP